MGIARSLLRPLQVAGQFGLFSTILLTFYPPMSSSSSSTTAKTTTCSPSSTTRTSEASAINPGQELTEEAQNLPKGSQLQGGTEGNYPTTDKTPTNDHHSSPTNRNSTPTVIFWNELATQAGNSIQVALDTGIPTQLSYGFLAGFCSGYALQKIGRVLAFGFGLGFISLQTLAYYGYVKVDHVKIQRDLMESSSWLLLGKGADAVDPHGDGHRPHPLPSASRSKSAQHSPQQQQDFKERKMAVDRYLHALQANLPAGSGYMWGFVSGLRA